MFICRLRGLLVAIAVVYATVRVEAQGALPTNCVCPEECNCSLLHSKIECANRNLRTIPSGINFCSWPGVATMQVYYVECDMLRKNHYCVIIYNLSRRALTSPTPFLVCRDLSGNQITRIPRFAFSLLRNLSKL